MRRTLSSASSINSVFWGNTATASFLSGDSPPFVTTHSPPKTWLLSKRIAMRMFCMARDSVGWTNSIIQPLIARTRSDTPRLCTHQGRPGGQTSSVKTCMAGDCQTRGIPSRKRPPMPLATRQRGLGQSGCGLNRRWPGGNPIPRPELRGHCPRLQRQPRCRRRGAAPGLSSCPSCNSWLQSQPPQKKRTKVPALPSGLRLSICEVCGPSGSRGVTGRGARAAEDRSSPGFCERSSGGCLRQGRLRTSGHDGPTE